jgi:hypothetical protein
MRTTAQSISLASITTLLGCMPVPAMDSKAADAVRATNTEQQQFLESVRGAYAQIDPQDQIPGISYNFVTVNESQNIAYQDSFDCHSGLYCEQYERGTPRNSDFTIGEKVYDGDGVTGFVVVIGNFEAAAPVVLSFTVTDGVKSIHFGDHSNYSRNGTFESVPLLHVPAFALAGPAGSLVGTWENVDEHIERSGPDESAGPGMSWITQTILSNVGNVTTQSFQCITISCDDTSILAETESGNWHLTGSFLGAGGKTILEITFSKLDRLSGIVHSIKNFDLYVDTSFSPYQFYSYEIASDSINIDPMWTKVD